MSNRSISGYRQAFSDHIENRLEVMPHMKHRDQAIELDPHQQEAMLEVAVAMQDAHRYKAFSIVHSCGSGKTIVEANLVGASQDAKSDLGVNGDRRDIILAIERSNLSVIRRQFEELGFDDLGIWGDGEKKLDRPVLLTTVQSLQMNRKQLHRLLPLDKIDLVIGDEADTYLTEQRKKLIEKLDPVMRVGFTATPTWRNGNDISDLWGPKIHHIPLKEGIRRGINVPPIWRLYEAKIDEEKLSIKGDDYDAKTLAAAMKHAEIHKAIPEIYRTVIERDRRKDFPTLVYVPNTYLVRMVTDTLREEFGKEGVNVQGWIGAEMSPAQIESDINAFRDGSLQILVLCEMGGRGLDLPTARLLIDAYPTLSPTKLEQRHGRVLRKVREGSPLHQKGFRKDYSVVVQVQPTSNRFRPICLPDILDGWEEAQQGKPMGGGGKGEVGAPWLEEVEELQKRIEAKRPTINISLVKQLDLYRHINRWDELPQADASGFFYLPKDYGTTEQS